MGTGGHKADATCVDAHLDGGELGLRVSCHHFIPTDGGTGTMGREGMLQRPW